MAALVPRSDFPALQPSRGKSEVPAYLDSACMSLVPSTVLDALRAYYTEYPGCGGRSVHRWAEEVTRRYEDARETFARFLGAPDPAHLVHVRNTTEGINVVARGFPFQRGDRVLVSDQEHNSNLVVWQYLVKEKGIRLEVLPLPDDRPFDPEALERALAKKVRLVSFFHSSNLDGRTLPAKEIVQRAHDHGAQVLFDGSQAAPHELIDLKSLGADFYALSFHKMLGPTGTGLLYGAPGALEQLSPLLRGGETVAWSDYDAHELLPPPHRFEAGLQNYAGVLGARAAVDYLAKVGMENIPPHHARLQRRVTKELADLPGLRLLGPPRPEDRGNIFAFVLAGINPHDVALFLDEGHGVLVRSGMNCVHSWYRARGLDGNARASFYLYTDEGDVDRFIAGVRELRERIPAPMVPA
ncbi:MAG: cysteine desulfurase [Euryarchaeota archaeon]|nr:cysteine desulfurase [Euryarchaeota archaeon]MDE2044854.1 cysteine desulfurase [Thermoplasmata archaeon]